MDIATAKQAFGADRILSLAVLHLLQHKGIIESGSDFVRLREYCKMMLGAFGTVNEDAVVRIQLNETERELEHIFHSFRKHPEPSQDS